MQNKPFPLKRYRAGRRQADMARMFGVSVRTYQRHERFSMVPETWLRIMGYDGVKNNDQ